MPYLLNLLYLLLLFAASPWLLYKAVTTGKYRRGMFRKLLGLTSIRKGDRPCVWFHAVSVGEVLLLRRVIARFRERYPAYECVLSTTTNTGYDVAVEKFPDLTVFYWPFDFTWAVKRALRRIRPHLVVLAELELWPNFIRITKGNGIPLAVINGRMTEQSFQGYRRLRRALGGVLASVDLYAVQTAEYAERFAALGIPRERIHVTGSVKYDGVNTDRNNSRTRQLGQLLNVQPDQLIWIVGSTQAPEEQIALDIYRKARERFPNLRLFLVPRHAERFDEVANLVKSSGLPLLRRRQLQPGHLATSSPFHQVILIDTLGELGALWGLADLAFVGGSLSGRGGQNMIEPAASGVAVTFGPEVWNFQDTVDRLLERRAAVQVADAVELERETLRLLGDAQGRAALGHAAQSFVQSQQGATAQTLDLLEQLLPVHQRRTRAA
jgi:3-deoxy-D-manno-octulosonic-acid transferase